MTCYAHMLHHFSSYLKYWGCVDDAEHMLRARVLISLQVTGQKEVIVCFIGSLEAAEGMEEEGRSTTGKWGSKV